MEKLFKELEAINKEGGRSAWGRGVGVYADELAAELAEALEWEAEHGGAGDLEVLTLEDLEKKLLNGADNWRHYSWSGCSLIYGGDIAARLCTPSQLKRKRGGDLPPYPGGDWLDEQARALFQAANRVKRAFIRSRSDTWTPPRIIEGKTYAEKKASLRELAIDWQGFDHGGLSC